MEQVNTTTIMLTGWDLMIIAAGFFLLIWSGLKVTSWLHDKTLKMKEPLGSIVLVCGMFGYIIFICTPAMLVYAFN